MPKWDIQKIVTQAQKQVDACLSYRQARLDQIKKSENVYFGKTRPALKGRFNIPVPILEGFVETLMSKIDDTVMVKFKKGRESTLKSAKKVSACWEKDSGPERGDFNSADLDAKKLAIFSGFGALELIPQSKPEYKQTLKAIDYYDLIFEPMGGRDLETHAFKGKLNVFKTKYDLEQGVKESDYNSEQVSSLISGVNDKEKKDWQDQAENKANRMIAMGLNPQYYGYLGDGVYNLTELITRFEGENYYLLFDKKSALAVKCVPLKEMFSSGLSPYVVWHTERNPVSFLCRAPVDGVRPVAEAMQILLNQNLDNIQKRNFDQILYDARKIIDPSQLEYRPNGIISVKLKDGESMASAYEKMQTPDTSTITINLIQWLDNFMGTKSGVTPGAQGNSKDERVAIYEGNQQQVADRFGMENKFYTQAHQQIAIRYKHNLRDHMPPRGFMVKFIGLRGAQEEEITRDDVEADLDVEVSSQNAEAQIDQKKQEKREIAISMLQKDPALRLQIGDKWLAEQILRNGEYEEDDIKSAMNKEEINEDLMSEAAKAIEEILDGKKPKLNRGANIAYVRKIANYAIDESDSLDDATFASLVDFAYQHLTIVEQNELMNAQLLNYARTIQQPAPIGENSGVSPTISGSALSGGQGQALAMGAPSPAGNAGGQP